MADTRKEQPETKLVKRMVTRLEKQGHLAWRNNTGTIYSKGRWISFGKKGSGDIFVVVKPNGRLLSVEVKVAKKKGTENQEAWMAKVREAGGVAGVARSMADLDKLVSEAAEEGISLF